MPLSASPCALRAGARRQEGVRRPSKTMYHDASTHGRSPCPVLPLRMCNLISLPLHACRINPTHTMCTGRASAP
eukprot:scaffold1465_cov383-Prasinococcus_capsulatus_cf.AAC.12